MKNVNIGKEIKNLAFMLLVFGILISILMFFISCFTYADNKSYIKYAYTGGMLGSDILMEAGRKAVSAQNNIKYSIILFIISIISYFPLSGFGQLILNSDIIVEHLSKEENNVEIVDSEPEETILEETNFN